MEVLAEVVSFCIYLICYALLLRADVASNWLACFPFSARKHVYVVFFVNGLATEVVQILVNYLQQSRSGDLDVNVVHSNMKRDGLRIEVQLL
ncbi:hypothetical protein RchiOBHm_Chr4g0412201 [Rosa chinensis]|uniref:Uncharacterized protein n=1 Tax=Rosa chinensis TaxID=74649 RepID=A0A2P6QVR9_ROSCH|nr:hypothetical protein RchiOBHm_Chr4g0412201 [Rosa chinensis]